MLEAPLAVDDAVEYVREWLSRQNVEFLASGQVHLDIALGLLRDVGTAGNLTTDAQLAAHAVECDGTMYSNDTDFARFPDLAWTNPLG